MFCHQCGKKLRENAHFCSYCGVSVREEPESPGSASTQSENATANAKGTDTADSKPHTEDTFASQKEYDSQGESQDRHDVDSQEQTGKQLDGQEQHDADSQEQTGRQLDGQEQHDADTPESVMPPAAPVAETIADLTLKKGKVVVTGGELRLHKKHYFRKSGKKKFRKIKKDSLVPLGSIIGVSLEHYKYGGRIFLSLLLLAAFSVCAFTLARWGYDTCRERSAPYRDKELEALEATIAILDNDGAECLLQYQDSQKDNRAEADDLSAQLAHLKTLQTQEILDAVYTSGRFDLDAFFNREPFSRAYQEYLQDLVTAFKEDELLNSWLYSYYGATEEYGGNYFLDTDMWIYSGDAENKFSSGLDSAANLANEHYDLDLYEHIQYTGRIYITGADFMQKILSLPRYTVDGAIFAKAYGGAPDPSEMSVPGWSRSHYEEFWLYGLDYYNVDTPMWLDYGLQAEDFGLDWNMLLDETAYYTAYRNFIDKIDPNLPCYDIAVYTADDTAYGGMGCSLKGTEASFSDMIASYAENHPEFIDELLQDKGYGKTLSTSVDKDITDAKARLAELDSELRDLQNQEKELAQLLANEDVYRNNYSLLLSDIEQHTQELTYRLLSFGGAALLCAIAALASLCRLIGLFKRPRHLFLIYCRDLEYAFSYRGCSKAQLELLQNRLPRQGNQRNEEGS